MLKVLREASGLLWLSRAIAKEMHWAETIALTKTARKAMKRVRQEVQDVFTIRRKFTIRGVQIKPAKVADKIPQATVFGGPSYLSYHALGIPKLPAPGRKSVGVPTKELRGAFSNPIPKAKRLPSLIKKAIAGQSKKRRRRRKGKAKRKIPFFFQYTRGGTRFNALVINTAFPTPGRKLNFLYVLPARVEIKETYSFHEIATKAVHDHFEKFYQIEVEKSIRRRKRRQKRAFK